MPSHIGLILYLPSPFRLYSGSYDARHGIAQPACRRVHTYRINKLDIRMSLFCILFLTVTNSEGNLISLLNSDKISMGNMFHGFTTENSILLQCPKF